MVPSFHHFPTDWEDQYDEVTEVVECINFSRKDDIVDIGWGDEFDSLDDESNCKEPT